MTCHALRRHLARFGIILSIALVSTGCLHRRRKGAALPPVTAIPGAPPAPAEQVRPADLAGVASWYGRAFEGRSTSDGEIYNMYAMTAAHRTLPFNTRVRVHDLDNGRSVDVRINDRGPFIGGRIIDLSYAAAEALGMAGAGIARVQLEILNPEVVSGTAAAKGIYAVQVGAFREENLALRLKEQIEPHFGPVVVESYNSSTQGLLYRVRVGKLTSEGTAAMLAKELRGAGLTGVTYVVRLN